MNAPAPNPAPDPPVACGLSAAELAKRRDELLPGLLARADRTERLSDGFRWRFGAEPGLLARIAAVIEQERRCCRFLRFRIEVEEAEGPVWLEATGPEGTVALLEQLMRG